MQTCYLKILEEISGFLIRLLQSLIPSKQILLASVVTWKNWIQGYIYFGAKNWNFVPSFHNMHFHKFLENLLYNSELIKITTDFYFLFPPLKLFLESTIPKISQCQLIAVTMVNLNYITCLSHSISNPGSQERQVLYC